MELLRARGEGKGSFVLAADTVVAVGRRILPKAEMTDEAANSLRLLSGRSHRVYSGITLVTPKGKCPSAAGGNPRALQAAVS